MQRLRGPSSPKSSSQDQNGHLPSRKAKGAASNGRGPPKQEPIAKRLSWPSWPIALYGRSDVMQGWPRADGKKTCNS
jgi:hypothetical protein